MAQKVGFVGLGNMGFYMARNLVQNGRQLVVYDIADKPKQLMKEMGAIVASSPAEVANKCREIVTMLPSSPHVLEVYTGKKGIFNTIDPAVSQKVAKLAIEKGASYVDAPVSGGVGAADSASLTFMVGGRKIDFENAVQYLSQMGKKWVHCGDVGMGQAAKICNNMLLAVCMIGTSEAYLLGEKLGLDAKVLASIINSSSGRNWSSDTYNPVPGVMEGVPANRDYEKGFGNVLMAKDLGLAQSAAVSNKVPTPLGAMAHQIYTLISQSEQAQMKDFGYVYQVLKHGLNAGKIKAKL